MKKTDFPLTPEDVMAVWTPKMGRIMDIALDLETAASDSLKCGEEDDYRMLAEAADILFDQARAMACAAFVEAYDVPAH